MKPVEPLPAAVRSGAPPLSVGPFRRIYDPCAGRREPWCINDHCFARDPAGRWHLFGITHLEPFNWSLDPARNLAHATADHLTQSPWRREPDALTADAAHGEIHLWAPHIVRHEGRYQMFVCVGNDDHTRYRIHLLASTDLWRWERHPANPIVIDGFDARDPCVIRLGEQWVMYYTATEPAEGGRHIVACRTSGDLVRWGERRIVYTDEECGTFGGPTESPFVVQRGDWFYLFICNNDRRAGYDDTDVLRSRDPFHWNFSDRVATLPAHAAEVVRDERGDWYLSHCGWFRGGVYLAPLTWHDGVAD